jgi:hypothetical protein
MYKNKLHSICSILLLIVFIIRQICISIHHHAPIITCDLVNNKEKNGVFHYHQLKTDECLICATILHKCFLLGKSVNFVFYPHEHQQTALVKNKKHQLLNPDYSIEF